MVKFKDDSVEEKLKRMVNAVPPGGLVTLSVDTLRDWLQTEVVGVDVTEVVAGVEYPQSWRERLWTVPPETRIGVVEAAEAIGKSTSWVYKHARAPKGERKEMILPFRKLGNDTVFVVGELREWLTEQEVV